MKPFNYSDSLKENLFEKLFRTKAHINCSIQIENYLASNDIGAISKEYIQKIIKQYKYHSSKKIYTQIRGLFENYVSYSFLSLDISRINFADIEILANCLEILDNDLKIITAKYSIIRFQSSIRKIFSNNPSIVENQEKILFIQRKLHIEKEDCEKIIYKEKKRIVSSVLYKALKNERFSPVDEQRIKELSEKLNIKIPNNKKINRIIEISKLLWSIENNKLSNIDIDINLFDQELCYYENFVNIHEINNISCSEEIFGYATKNNSPFHIHKKNISDFYENPLLKIDSGKIYVTNRRMIFIGKYKNIILRIENIKITRIYSNGVEITNGMKENLLITTKDDLGQLGIILAYVIRGNEI